MKSNLAQGLGIEDSAYQEADAIVKAFADKHGPDNVRLLGHSLGGGLATWAGIKNGVEVTGFNSAGLHPNLRNRLGADRIDKAMREGKVRHFNTKKDPISQFLEGRRFGLDASSQVGVRYLIPKSKGHSLLHHENALKRLVRAEPVL
jgi:putative lipase involved disintegration of autophagic bodies